MTFPRSASRGDPLVTIVTPSFNQGSLIRSTIESVLRQDYPRVEYIIRDGGSTDETARIASEYAGRLTFVSEPDFGQSDAINRGFRQAKGSIVAWLNSDDTLFPGAIRKAVRALGEHPDAGAVYGDGYLIDHDGVVASRFPFTRSPDLWKLVHLSDFILQQTVFFRRSALTAVGFLDEALHWTMDWDVLIRLGLRFPLLPVREFLGCLRIHTKTSSGGMRRILEIRRMLRRHGAGQVPPAFVAYGIGAIAAAIDRPLARLSPRSFSRSGEALRDAVRRGTSWASWRLRHERQGHWDDGWAAPVASFSLPPESGRLLIEGSVPGWFPPPGDQELRLTLASEDGPFLEPAPGARLLLVHTGGLGDLVLVSELIAGAKREGGLVVTLVCRAEVAAAAALFPVPPDSVVPIAFDPHRWSTPSTELFSALELVVVRLRRLKINVVVDGALRPTWFGWLAAAAAGAGSFLACGDYREPGPLLGQVLDRFGLTRPAWTGPAYRPESHERERYRRLLDALGCRDGVPGFPWRRPPGARAATARFLGEAGIEPGTYVACFPGGAPTTHVKRWPAERFVEVLQDLQKRHRLPVVLVGNTSERDVLERISEALGGGAAPVAFFSGSPSEIPVLADLLADARLTLGNDTGPMHLASAYGVAGVAIYGGGGRWPSYAPWSAGSIGLHHPLPCYGCDWDCFLGHGLCVESIPVQAVLHAVEELLAGRHGPPESRPLDLVRDSVVRMVADASAGYREAQADRGARLDVIVQLERAVAGVLMASKRWIEDLERRLQGAFVRSRGLNLPEVHAFQIPTGLGAGNIGDDLMAGAFWEHLPATVRLDVALFGESGRQHEPVPARHRTRPVDWAGNEAARAGGMPALLVGGTPVAESEGLAFPLRFLEPRLAHFRREGQPVDAVGIGVDRLESADAINLFRRTFSPVRSWTVRSPACREALLELGVEPGRIRVGADWAWLHRPKQDRTAWAAERWRALGIEEDEPLLVVNVVNMNWKEEVRSKEETAAALDLAAAQLGLRIAFFCNECRDGPFFDHEAARETAAAMRTRAAFVPNEYFSPDEAVALLARATVTAGARYHFVVESVLAGTVPVPLVRGQKMAGLSAELELPPGGTVGAIERDRLFESIRTALEEREERLSLLALRRASLARRATENLSFLRELSPYLLGKERGADEDGGREGGA